MVVCEDGELLISSGRIVRGFCRAALFACVLLGVGVSSAGTAWYASPSPKSLAESGADYCRTSASAGTVRDAIGLAKAGDSVVLADGEYRLSPESWAKPGEYLDLQRPIEIRSASGDAKRCVLDGTGGFAAFSFGDPKAGDGLVVQGVTFRNFNPKVPVFKCGGVVRSGVMKDCVISSSGAFGPLVHIVADVSRPERMWRFYRCAFLGNSRGRTTYNYGITACYNCLFVENSGYFSGTMYNCTFVGNRIQNAAMLEGGASCPSNGVYNCLFFANQYALDSNCPFAIQRGAWLAKRTPLMKNSIYDGHPLPDLAADNFRLDASAIRFAENAQGLPILRRDSMAVDRGIDYPGVDDPESELSKDFLGRPRKQGRHVDVGCLEFGAEAEAQKPTADTVVNSVRVRPGDDVMVAVERLRRVRRRDLPAEIVFADGTYCFTSNNVIRLDMRDNNLTLRAEHPGKVEFIGSYEFKGRDFVSVSEPRLRVRFRKNVVDKIRMLRLTAEQLAEFRPQGEKMIRGVGFAMPNFEWSPPYNCPFNSDGSRAEKELDDRPFLVVGDCPQIPARWPNGGEFVIRQTEDSWVKTAKGARACRLGTERPSTWDFSSGDVVFSGKPNGWEVWTFRIGSWDAETHAVTDMPFLADGYFENVLEEIDEPGEWWIDRASSTLCYYPCADFGPTTRCSLACTRTSMIQLVNTTDVTIEGLAFSRKISSPAVAASQCERTTIQGCSFTALGYLAVAVGGWTNVVRSCDFRNLYLYAIDMAGGDGRLLVNGNNRVENCLFDNCGVLKASGELIQIKGCGNAVSHCEVRHTPHGAICFGGPHMLVEYNRLVDCCSKNHDCGALYGWGSYMSIGSVIRYNDVGTTALSGNGIYLDDVTSGCQIYGNIVRDCQNADVFLGGGRENVVSNNVLVGPAGGIYMDNRGLWWNQYQHPQRTHENWVRTFDYTNGPWRTQHPSVGKWHLDPKTMFAPTDNAFVNNLAVDYAGSMCYAGNLAEFKGLRPPEGGLCSTGNVYVVLEPNGPREMKMWRIGGWTQLQGDGTNALDLGFRDFPKRTSYAPYRWQRGDFSLRDDSWFRAHMPGFRPIPWREIGLYRDKWRVVVPNDDLDWFMGTLPGPKRYFVSPDGAGGEYSSDFPGKLFELAKSRKLVLGDEIVLKDGTYDFSSVEYGESIAIRRSGTVFEKGRSALNLPDVTIRSESGNPLRCILDGGRVGKGRALTVGRYQKGAFVAGIMFRNFTGSEYAGALQIPECSGTVSNCVFECNSAAFGGAASRGGTYVGCIFRKNEATRAGGAVYGFVRLEKCLFVDNAVLGADGFAGAAAAESIACWNPTAVDCKFVCNQSSSAKWPVLDGAVRTENCRFLEKQEGASR